jgi:GGDEF domain-containing protein
LPALFASCGRTHGGEFFTLADAGVNPTPVRLRLADERLLDCTLRPLSSGGFVLGLDDVTALVRDAELARCDPLTGLPNRSSLRRQLAERLADARRTKQSVAVLYVDLDRFKAVNDSLGHPVGDALLLKVADRLKSALREETWSPASAGTSCRHTIRRTPT